MSDRQTQSMARCMAWSRAKGELNSMLDTFYAVTKKDIQQFDKLDETIKKFISEVEAFGLQE